MSFASVSCNRSEETIASGVDVLSQGESILTDAGYQEISIKISSTRDVDYSCNILIRNDSIISEVLNRSDVEIFSTRLNSEEQKWVKYLVDNLETADIEDAELSQLQWILTIERNKMVVFRDAVTEEYYRLPQRVRELIFTVLSLSNVRLSAFYPVLYRR